MVCPPKFYLEVHSQEIRTVDLKPKCALDLGDLIKTQPAAGHQWPTPVILATWEAEIRKISV
jgi:hypothetical protein